MTTTSRRLALAATITLAVSLGAAGCGGDQGVGDVAAPAPGAASADPRGAAEVAPAGGTPTAQIPDGFPLAADLPTSNGDDGSPVRVTEQPGTDGIELCGEHAWTPADTVDVAGVVYTGEAEDVRSRTLALYPDEPSAIAALDHLREAVATCPAGTVGGTDQVYESVAESATAVTYTHRYRYQGAFDTGLEVIEVVRVGPALYLASYYGEGGGSAGTIRSSVDEAAASSAGVIDAMGAFAPDLDPAPADVALDAGWPTETHEPGSAGLELPVDELTIAFSDYACQGVEPTATTDDVVRGQFSDVESYLGRELLTFADADAAVAYVAALREYYATCPPRSADGYTNRVRVVDTGLGGQSFAAVSTAEFGGAPAIGLSALHTIRVGRAVLLDYVSNEGTAATEAEARDLAASMGTRSGDVVAAMCAYTEAGC